MLLKMARLCEAVYIKDDSARISRFFELGGECLAWLDEDGTQAMLLRSGGRHYLVFRGTDEPGDWLDDMDVRKVNTPSGYVHAGFERGVSAIWKELEVALFQNRVKSLIVCGHSKGAGEALRAAERLHKFYPVIKAAYLFGCPRVKGVLAQRPEFPVFRIVNNNDVVCRVPSALRFKHVGYRFYIDKNGKVIKGITPWKITVDRLTGRWAAKNLLDGLSDHPIKQYVKQLGG